MPSRPDATTFHSEGAAVDVRGPRARTIARTGDSEATVDHAVPLREVLVTLTRLSSSGQHSGGWVDTGAVADAIGATVGEAAARLRTAKRQGLCAIRRSLRDGTGWKPTDAGAQRLTRVHKEGLGG